MRYILLLIFFIVTSPAAADVLIGFRGKNGAFDTNAFQRLASQRKLMPIILDSADIKKALDQIKNNPTYELYGYSLGAASVARTLREIERNNLHKPKFVITAGAYHTTDVDFTKYKVKFINYFDSSGVGQRSPGLHIGGVSHGKIMEYVTNDLQLNR